MDIENKILTTADLKLLEDYKIKNNFTERYCHPHPMWEDIDIYGKWLSTIIIFNKIKQSGMKVCDLGSGDSPIPHIISDQGYEVDAIDIKDCNSPYQSLAVMVLRDAFEYLKEYDYNSIDVFTDVCAAIHFDCYGGNKQTPNKGLRNIFESIYKVLKPGGYFICCSDISLTNDHLIGEWVNPYDIIRMAEESGLALTSEYKYNIDDAWVRIEQNHVGVSNFLFTKKI